MEPDNQQTTQLERWNNRHVAVVGRLGRFGSALVHPPIFIENANDAFAFAAQRRDKAEQEQQRNAEQERIDKQRLIDKHDRRSDTIGPASQFGEQQQELTLPDAPPLADRIPWISGYELWPNNSDPDLQKAQTSIKDMMNDLRQGKVDKAWTIQENLKLRRLPKAQMETTAIADVNNHLNQIALKSKKLGKYDVAIGKAALLAILGVNPDNVFIMTAATGERESDEVIALVAVRTSDNAWHFLAMPNRPNENTDFTFQHFVDGGFEPVFMIGINDAYSIERAGKYPPAEQPPEPAPQNETQKNDWLHLKSWNVAVAPSAQVAPV